MDATAEHADLRREIQRLQAENARLSRLLELRGQGTAPPPEQLSAPVAVPGMVTMASPVADKLALFADRFRARTDVYAIRWENTRTGASGWSPAVAGGWRKGMDRRSAVHLPLTPEVMAAHLVGDVFMGLYPLLTDNSCHFLAADFDGSTAMLDALAYCKAARASGVPAALEISQSGRGAHAWIFFTGPIPATTARTVGTVLLHEAMVLRGSMDLRSSYPTNLASRASGTDRQQQGEHVKYSVSNCAFGPQDFPAVSDFLANWSNLPATVRRTRR